MSYKMLFITVNPKPWLSAWGVWFACQPYEDGFIIPLGWEEELTKRGIEFTEIEITPEAPKNEPTITKLYFSTPEERDAFNAAEAEYAEEDPSLPYLETGEDENGYYLLVDVVAKPSLWQRFKNWF